MNRVTSVATCVALLCGWEFASAQRVRRHGHAIVEYASPQVRAVAAYEYSRRNHSGSWLLVELAVQATKRITITRTQIAMLTPDERIVPLATQQQFLEDQQAITQLLQNATIWRRPLGSYFNVGAQPTIQFFSSPGRIVHDSFVSNLDDVGSGDLFFSSRDRRWPAGSYRLRIDHQDAQAELPIELD